jgi:hypothetical protein
MSLLTEYREIQKLVDIMIADTEEMHDTLVTIRRKTSKEITR